MSKKDTAIKDIARLKSEVSKKLDTIAELALKHNIETSISIRDSSFSVLLPTEDEDTIDRMRDEYDIEPGEWVSSSDYC